MPTDLISRLSAGRFEGDNAEVLKALGYSWRWAGGEVISTFKGDKLFVNYGLFPLSDMNAALRLVPEGWFTLAARESVTNSGTWAWTLAHRIDGEAVARGLGPTAAHSLVLAILRAKEADRG